MPCFFLSAYVKITSLFSVNSYLTLRIEGGVIDGQFV